jgi:hypothetical protein
MQRRSIDCFTVSDLPDRLALTAQDRRLESMVLLGMMRNSDSAREGGHARGESAGDDAPDVPDATEDSVYEHAVGIAGFLCTEYAVETLEQKVLISELAVEFAQRIAEDLAQLSKPSPG